MYFHYILIVDDRTPYKLIHIDLQAHFRAQNDNPRCPSTTGQEADSGLTPN